MTYMDVSNTDISTRCIETSGLPVIRQQLDMNGLSCVVNFQSIHSVQFPMCPDCTSARQLCLIIDRRHCPGANSARNTGREICPVNYRQEGPDAASSTARGASRPVRCP